MRRGKVPLVSVLWLRVADGYIVRSCVWSYNKVAKDMNIKMRAMCAFGVTHDLYTVIVDDFMSYEVNPLL